MRDSREYYLLRLREILLTHDSFRQLQVVQQPLMQLSADILQDATTEDALVSRLSFFLFSFVEFVKEKISHEFWLIMKKLHAQDVNGEEFCEERAYLTRLQSPLLKMHILFWEQYNTSSCADVCASLNNTAQALTNEYNNWLNQQLWVTLQQKPIEQFSKSLLDDMRRMQSIVTNCFSIFADTKKTLGDLSRLSTLKDDDSDWMSKP